MNITFLALGIVSIPVLVIILFIFYKTIVFFTENNTTLTPAPVQSQITSPEKVSFSTDTDDEEVIAVITAALRVYLK